jgi:hypothetical protein
MKELTLKEQRFIDLYTNPENRETFGNATKSVKQAGYLVKNDDVAGVYGVRLLRKDRIKLRMEEMMEKFEIDVSKHFRTLDKKLDNLAQEGKISREELMAVRLFAEAQGVIGKGGINVGIAIGDRPCADCPHSKPLFVDLTAEEDARRIVAEAEEEPAKLNTNLEGA